VWIDTTAGLRGWGVLSGNALVFSDLNVVREAGGWVLQIKNDVKNSNTDFRYRK
jgi:hypothetical protein